MRRPWGLAAVGFVTGVALAGGGAWVIFAFVVPATNGEALAVNAAGSIVVQVLGGLAILAGFALTLWLVVLLAGRLRPDEPRDAAIDARIVAALAKDDAKGASDPLPVPSGLPWERARGGS